jgi:hypothetical protein
MWIHVALCAAALAFAWTSAHQVAEKQGGPSSVTLLAAAAGDIVGASYRWDKGSTVTTLSGTGAARHALVKVDRELPAKKPAKADAKDGADPKAGAEAAAVPAAIAELPERETGTIPGGKTVLAAIAGLEPCKTKRSLGVVDDVRLEAMGLKNPLRSLEVKTASGQSLVLEIGEASYGAQGRYARVKGQPEVHLIDTAIVTGLEGGIDALLEKRALTAELETITGYSVVVGAKSGAFTHVDREQVSTRFFAIDGVKKEAAGKLMTTLRNLRGSKLASADASTAAGAVVKVVVDTTGGPVTIEMVERGAGEGNLLRTGGFVYEITATQARELQDDVDAAVAE